MVNMYPVPFGVKVMRSLKAFARNQAEWLFVIGLVGAAAFTAVVIIP